MSDNQQSETQQQPHPDAEGVDAGFATTDAEALAQAQGELVALQAKCNDLAVQYLRAKADAENARRRAEEEVSKARKFGVESFAESLLPVADSLEAGLAIKDGTVQQIREGAEATLRQLKVLAPGKKLPAISKLNTEIEALISEKNAAYNTYRTAKAEYEQLATAKRNAEQILHGTPSRQKKHEQER